IYAQWRQIPSQSVALANPWSLAASFVAPEVQAQEVLTFELTGWNQYGLPDVSFTSVTVQRENVAPVEPARPAQAGRHGEQVVLRATGSYDASGDGLSFSWMQLAGPPVTLSDPTSAMPSFAAPEVAGSPLQLVFQLAVTDQPSGACGGPLTSISAVTVTVE